MPACTTARRLAGAPGLTLAGRRIARVLLILAAFFGLLDGEAAPAVNIAPPALARVVLLDAARAGERIVAVGEQGYVVLSEDQGKTWRRAATPTDATLTAVYFADAQQGWAVGHHSLILRSSDGGASWQRQTAPQPEITLLDVWFLNGMRGIAVGAYGALLRTEDGGNSWRAQAVFAGEGRHLNAIAGGADGKVYIAGEGGLFYASNDGGATWVARKTPYAGSLFGVLRLAPLEVLVFGLRGHILHSTDGGVTWQESRNGSAATLLGGALTTAGTVVLSGRGGTVLLSRDRGKSFTRLPASARNDYATALPLSERSALLVGQGGPLLSRLGDD